MLPTETHCPATRGMTLSELLISLVIVSFMMVGIFATDHAVRSMNAKVTGDIAMMMQARSIAEYVRRDAMRATGELNSPGIDTSIADSICFRLDDEANPTPTNYTDDIWVCYSIRNNAGRKSDLYRCVGAVGGVANACNNGGTFIGRLRSTTGPPRSCFDLNPPTFLSNHFFTRLQVVSNPAANWDVNLNPMVEVDVSVYPMGHSNF